MKPLRIILVSLILLFSCEKNDNICNCNDPLNDLVWLKELKNSFTNCTCEMSVIQAYYKNQIVFYTEMTDPLCDGFQNLVLLDCKGNVAKSYESGDQSMNSEVMGRNVLYRCKTK